MSTESTRTENDLNHVCQNLHFSQEYLSKCEIETDLECAVKNCGEIFSNRSALNLHLEKVHRVRLKPNDKPNEYTLTRSMSKKTKEFKNCKCEYYCPVSKCKYGLLGKTSLPTFHSLKVHFIRIHGDKKHSCRRCSKSFSIKSELERHERTCGYLIKCEICQVDFSTYQSYRKHCVKKGHKIDEKSAVERPGFKPVKKKSETIQKISSSVYSNGNRQQINNDAVLNKNHALQSNSQINYNMPIIIIPFTTAVNISNSDVMMPPEVGTGGTVITTLMDNQQRSFGCQTSINTQETGSQTKTNDIGQQQGTQTNMSVTSSSSGYPAMTSTSQTIPAELNVDYLQDAATSTSPLLEDIELFLNDISTQTINPQGIEQLRSISIQTQEQSLMVSSLKEKSTSSISTFEYMSQTNFGHDDNQKHQSQHSHSNSNDTHDLQHQQQQANNSSCDQSDIIISKKQSYAGYANAANCAESQHSRCLTPVNMCNAPSQTEDLYFNMIMNTNSIQTQTNFNNGAQTQTDFDFE